MDPAALSTTSAQARRTNPSRSRRGGPGVGTSDVDVMILESYKRKLETEPLIPSDTTFFLTTNSAKVSGEATSNGDSAISINIVANDRYFDRPEVLKAFREQEIIQTPEFWPISESSSVGGRFRPRGAEDEREETSDTAYEKRHKKFETFEKRQRLREKDKLKHEHYKLKERIEQLRAMDSSAFMGLPFSFGVAHQEEQVIAEVDQTTEVPQAQANGITPPTEGERRKKAMLEHAIGLEKRYSYLLPPDRVRKTQEIHAEDEESESERTPQAGSSKNDSIRFRLPARSSLSTTPASSPAATKPPRKYTKGQGKQALSARPVQNNIPLDQVSSVSSPYIDIEMHTPEPRQVSPPPPPSSLPAPPIEVLEVPVPPALVAPLPKPPTSALQTNGRALVQKDTYSLQNTADTEAAVVQPPEKVPPRKTPRMRPIQVQIAEDGESEKAPSEDGHVEVPESEAALEKPELQPEQPSTEAPAVEVDTQMLGPDEVPPEVRELSTRLEQTSVTGPPTMETMEQQQTLSDELYYEQPVTEGQLPEESISTRPAKRQKKMSWKVRAQSVGQSAAQSQVERTPSVPPIASLTATGRPRKKITVPRGQQTAVYTSSTTGEEILTMSSLLMAAIRSEGAKRNVEKRHNTSFGVPTPTFKELYDFEIPEWLHFPEDEEPAIPISDLDPPHLSIAGDHAEQTVPDHTEPEPLTEREPEEEEIPISALRDEVAAPALAEVSQPIQTESGKPEDVQPIPTEKTPEPEPEPEQEQEQEADHMETEPAEVEEEDEAPSPTEHESEPGVSIRVLSHPRDSDDEQLEW